MSAYEGSDMGREGVIVAKPKLLDCDSVLKLRHRDRGGPLYFTLRRFANGSLFRF